MQKRCAYAYTWYILYQVAAFEYGLTTTAVMPYAHAVCYLCDVRSHLRTMVALVAAYRGCDHAIETCIHAIISLLPTNAASARKVCQVPVKSYLKSLTFFICCLCVCVFFLCVGRSFLRFSSFVFFLFFSERVLYIRTEIRTMIPGRSLLSIFLCQSFFLYV